MSDIAFNPGVGSGWTGSIDRTGQAAASTSRASSIATLSLDASERLNPAPLLTIRVSESSSVADIQRSLK